MLQAGISCQRCTEGKLSRLETPDDQTQAQRERGCHGDAIAPIGIDGEDFLRCPVRTLDWEGVGPVLEVLPHLREGRYPAAGGYADQPALYLELLALIDQLKREPQKDDDGRGR